MSSAYRYLQRMAHESPVIFYSLALGSVGPILAISVPPIRKSMGWKPADRIPTTFPVPNRPREAVSGYEDP